MIDGDTLLTSAGSHSPVEGTFDISNGVKAGLGCVVGYGRADFVSAFYSPDRCIFCQAEASVGRVPGQIRSQTNPPIFHEMDSFFEFRGSFHSAPSPGAMLPGGWE
jgi:hypothetical protein